MNASIFLISFFFDELGGVEVFDFPGDLGVIPGRIELGNPADSRLAGTDRLPSLVYAGPERGDEPQAGYDNASLPTIIH
jgi:hypothetical protein